MLLAIPLLIIPFALYNLAMTGLFGDGGVAVLDRESKSNGEPNWQSLKMQQVGRRMAEAAETAARHRPGAWRSSVAANLERAWDINTGSGMRVAVLEQTGLLGMVGKAERGPVAREAIREHRSAYLMAVGGAAYLVSKAIKAARVVAFEDLGMEAIYEFTVQDMPVTVAVDSTGASVHESGPREWQARIGKIPVVVA